ncbi:DUF3570 domain-containing protein [Dyadobacter frigoris]|uniref:DUF3570 domain-containing protein n=1 Tax=Dyadobacter frigoris TaxID=2576211 RepID=A0A4U6D4Y4_9BACT|nr:DUF3570 domain-containing protein [Dyadobacter frigoris]TKT91241.1 DUF3570 domain-containing protein [Dyadobacter frigoris]GLU57194.1 hypothetical protein Dfri01_66550 [Dyadobacter frigoris]
MKRKFLLAGLLSVFLFKAKAQSSDSTYQKNTVSKTDIEVVYSHYIQNGHNSAVTGGIGTEKMTVYSPSVRIAHTFKEFNTIRFVGGADVISSASVDNIDFVMSSASRRDTRSYGTLNYQRQLKKKDIRLGIGSGFSIESDYMSIPLFLSADYVNPSKTRTFSIDLQAYFDDLRWGRLDPDYYHAVKLIYPVELRYKKWFDNYRRDSYNVKLGFTQSINPRLVLGIFPEFAYQKGLLSTSFHRVYFNNDSLKVENLPGDRFKFPVSLRLNYFMGSRTILKLNYGFYWDSFDILGNSIELEAAVKISSQWTIAPFFRYYKQSGSDYFKPYKQHNISEKYYTSDYDLSSFQTYKPGINLRFLPSQYLTKRISFDELNLRYTYFHRSNGLNAHIITLALKFGREKRSFRDME